MAPIDQYGAIVQRVLATYAPLKPSYGEVDVETVADEAQGHDELMRSGWNGMIPSCSRSSTTHPFHETLTPA